jgi:hypothetical protein
MFGVALVCIRDDKLVDDKAEGDVASVVSPEDRGVSARGIAILCKVGHELVVS